MTDKIDTVTIMRKCDTAMQESRVLILRAYDGQYDADAMRACKHIDEARDMIQRFGKSTK